MRDPASWLPLAPAASSRNVWPICLTTSVHTCIVYHFRDQDVHLGVPHYLLCQHHFLFRWTRTQRKGKQRVRPPVRLFPSDKTTSKSQQCKVLAILRLAWQRLPRYVTTPTTDSRLRAYNTGLGNKACTRLRDLPTHIPRLARK